MSLYDVHRTPARRQSSGRRRMRGSWRDANRTRSGECVLDQLEHDVVIDSERVEPTTDDVFPVKKHIASPVGTDETETLSVQDARDTAGHRPSALVQLLALRSSTRRMRSRPRGSTTSFASGAGVRLRMGRYVVHVAPL